MMDESGYASYPIAAINNQIPYNQFFNDLPIKNFKAAYNDKMEINDIFSVMKVRLKKKEIIVLNIGKNYEKNKFDFYVPLKSVLKSKINFIEREVNGIVFENIYNLSGKLKLMLNLDKIPFCKFSYFKENFERMNFESDFFEYLGRIVYCKISYEKTNKKNEVYRSNPNLNMKKPVNYKFQNPNKMFFDQSMQLSNNMSEIDIYKSAKQNCEKENVNCSIRKDVPSFYGQLIINEFIKTELNFNKNSQKKNENIIGSKNSINNLENKNDLNLIEEIEEYGRKGVKYFRSELKELNLENKLKSKKNKTQNLEYYQVKTEESSTSTDCGLAKKSNFRLLTEVGNLKFQNEKVHFLNTDFPNELPNLKNLKKNKIAEKLNQVNMRKKIKSMFKKLDIIPIDTLDKINVENEKLDKENINIKNPIDQLLHQGYLPTILETKFETLTKSDENETLANTQEVESLQELYSEIINLIQSLIEKLAQEYHDNAEDILNLESSYKKDTEKFTEIKLKLQFLIYLYLSNKILFDEETLKSPIETFQDPVLIKYFTIIKQNLLNIFFDSSAILSYYQEIKNNFSTSGVNQFLFQTFIINKIISTRNQKVLNFLSLIFLSEKNELLYEEFIKYRQLILNNDLKDKIQFLKKIIRKVLQNKTYHLTEMKNILNISDNQINKFLFLDTGKESKLDETTKKEVQLLFNNIICYLTN